MLPHYFFNPTVKPFNLRDLKILNIFCRLWVMPVTDPCIEPLHLFVLYSAAQGNQM